SLVGSSTIAMTYGIPVLPENDPYILSIEEGVRTSSDLFSEGKFLVDVFPWLRHIPGWFPGAGFQARAAEMRKISHEVRNGPFLATQTMIVSHLFFDFRA